MTERPRVLVLHNRYRSRGGEERAAEELGDPPDLSRTGRGRYALLLEPR